MAGGRHYHCQVACSGALGLCWVTAENKLGPCDGHTGSGQGNRDLGGEAAYTEPQAPRLGAEPRNPSTRCLPRLGPEVGRALPSP